MQTIKAIAIDDEPLAIDIIKEYSNKVDNIELVETFNSAIDALKYISNNNVDLIFLDIQMPDINGMDFLKILNKKPYVIFTTAYDKYAIEGYEFNTIDYLLKPFAFDRFYMAINKVCEIVHAKSMSQIQPNTEILSDFFFVKSEHKIVKIKNNSVLYIEGLKDYLKIVTDNNFVLTLMSFKSLVELIPENQFCRVHKSFAVAINQIETIEKSRIRIGDKYIPIGDSYKDKFFEKIKI